MNVFCVTLTLLSSPPGPILRGPLVCPLVPGDRPDLGVGGAHHQGHHPHQVS